MKNLSCTLVMLVCLMSVVSANSAQDMASLCQTAEETVKTANPQFKLISKDDRGKLIIYRWGEEKAAYVILTIFYGDSEQEASEEMKALINRLSVGPGEKITGYGEEAYMWKSPTRGFAGIRFRKANVFVDLSGPSRAYVEDLAKKLSDHVKKK